MPLTLQAQESLPYVDSPPSSQAFIAAKALIESECEHPRGSALHSSLTSDYEALFSPLIEETHSRLARGGLPREVGEGLDLTRYEEPEAPTSEDDSGNNAWRKLLHKAYTSHLYLEQRNFNLSLLERFGKNAWLIANAQVEDELLKPAEQELERIKKEIEDVERRRREGQEAVKGEVEGLDETWRATIGRAIEAEIAIEALRAKALENRRSVN